ncbi:MAG TPA: hypothetical protein VFB25_00860 [Gaiellaceae bacterium]|nr:hypothetical protein [Gaiellaceae bacterium]
MRRFSSLLVLAMAAIGIASAVSGGAAAMKATHHCLPKRHTCAAKKTPSTKKPAPSAPVQPVAAPAGSSPLHTNIVATTFWVGEIFDADLSDGSQACSTYDSEWAYHWSGGADVGTDPSTDCAGAPIGGCDGVPSGTGSSFTCATQKRTAANGYFPTDPSVHPAQNPFYVDLPFDDVNDPVAFRERCQVIPWADQFPAADCARATFSYMKNHWVQITGPNGNTCYGQVEDAGPSSGSAYHDATYVFSTTDARPANKKYSGDATQGDGMDVSPALNGCLGFKELDGDDDHVAWRFVDAPPAGPWTRVVTSSQVSQ